MFCGVSIGDRRHAVYERDERRRVYAGERGSSYQRPGSLASRGYAGAARSYSAYGRPYSSSFGCGGSPFGGGLAAEAAFMAKQAACLADWAASGRARVPATRREMIPMSYCPPSAAPM